MKTPHLLTLLLTALVIANSALAQQPKEIYQDFRNKRAFDHNFRLQGGPEPEAEMKPEKEGLRITMAADRERNHNLDEVIANFTPISGDFEFTATFEILDAQKKPAKGYGVGVNLTISMPGAEKKFGKLCRVFRVKEGSNWVGEAWPKFKNKLAKTETMTGQLRLARHGGTLLYLVSDGAGKEFEEIWNVPDFGDGDIDYLGFQVQDGAQPNNPVDARLIDLRVRYGKLDPAKTTAAAPLDAPAPIGVGDNPAPRAADPATTTGIPRWMYALAIALIALVLLLIIVAILFIVMRRRKPADADAPASEPEDEPEQPAAPTVVTCAACGKKLKVKAQSAGKRVKCPGCGKAVAVPVGEP